MKINVQRIKELEIYQSKGNISQQDEDELDSLLIDVKQRLEELRKEIEKEQISYGEIAELETLKEFIDPEDTQLLEWSGVPE